MVFQLCLQFPGVATLPSSQPAVVVCAGNCLNLEQNKCVRWQSATLPAWFHPSSPVQPSQAETTIQVRGITRRCGDVIWSFAYDLCWGLAPFGASGSRRWLFGLQRDVPLALPLPRMPLLSETEGPYPLFSLMRFSVGKALVYFLFLFTSNHFNSPKGHYFISGKMWSIWVRWAPTWAQMIWQILKREHVAWIINKRNSQRFGLACLIFFSDLSVLITATCSFVFL